MERIFLDFLTKEGVIGMVYHYCGRPVLAALDSDEPRDWLLDLFLFENTKEGFDFWIRVQEKWLDYLDSYERDKE